jgi:hypothetical protein
VILSRRMLIASLGLALPAAAAEAATTRKHKKTLHPAKGAHAAKAHKSVHHVSATRHKPATPAPTQG